MNIRIATMLLASASATGLLVAAPSAAAQVGPLGNALGTNMMSGPDVARFADGPADEILVTARRDGYGVTTTRAGNKTDTEIVDVPQTMTVVGAQQISDQALRSITDLVRFVPGVSGAQGEGHRDQIVLRGNNSTADFFVDGLRDDVQYYRPFYNIERVEVLKGANALIFGRGGGGGVINRVLKNPRDTGTFGGGLLAIDQFGAAAVEGDVNVALDQGAVRLLGMVERLDNHRPQFRGTRWAINPAGAVRIGDAHKVQLSFEHIEDDRSVDRGIPSFRDRPLEGARDLVFGDRSTNRTSFNGDVVRLRSEHAVASDIELSTSFLIGDYDKAYRNVFASGPVVVDADGRRSVLLGAYADATDRQSAIGQVNLTGTTATGSVSHQWLIGLEHVRQDTLAARTNGFFRDAAGLLTRGVSVTLPDDLDGVVTAPVTFIEGPAGAGNRTSDGRVTVWSAYAQDQVAIAPWLTVLAGIRHDRFAVRVDNVFTGERARRTDSLWSPRGAVIVHPVADASVYASFGRSWLPQAGDQFTTLDAVSETLKPERFDQYELGAKWLPRPGLIVTAAVYRLDRLNGRAAGPVPGTVIQTGAQRTDGAELGVSGTIASGWQVSAGYALTDAVYRSGDLAGRDVPQVPRHALSLWSRHDVGDALSFGIGATHHSRRFASTSNTVVLPSTTRVDAMAMWKAAPGLDVQLNIDNLFNADLVPNAHSDQNLTVGAPRTARLTIKAGF